MHTSKVLSGKDTAVAVYASFKNRLDILSKKGKYSYQIKTISHMTINFFRKRMLKL